MLVKYLYSYYLRSYFFIFIFEINKIFFFQISYLGPNSVCRKALDTVCTARHVIGCVTVQWEKFTFTLCSLISVFSPILLPFLQCLGNINSVWKFNNALVSRIVLLREDNKRGPLRVTICTRLDSFTRVYS